MYASLRFAEGRGARESTFIKGIKLFIIFVFLKKRGTKSFHAVLQRSAAQKRSRNLGSALREQPTHGRKPSDV